MTRRAARAVWLTAPILLAGLAHVAVITLDLAPGLARALGVDTGDLVELLGRHPAPLRAWVRVDASLADGEIGLDAFGRRVLGVESGATVGLTLLPMPPVPGGLADGPGWK